MSIVNVSQVYLPMFPALGYVYPMKQNDDAHYLLSDKGGTVATTRTRLLECGNAAFTYTNNDELKAKTEGGQTTTYDYDAFGNLRSVVLPDGTRIDYVIDGQNRRVGKKVNGTLAQGFLYEDQRGAGGGARRGGRPGFALCLPQSRPRSGLHGQRRRDLPYPERRLGQPAFGDQHDAAIHIHIFPCDQGGGKAGKSRGKLGGKVEVIIAESPDPDCICEKAGRYG